MERTLLYYPAIFIQNQQWIRQSILYWDSIGSIIPEGMERYLAKSHDFQILLNQGLYKIYNPENYVQSNNKVETEFEATLENSRFIESLPNEDRYSSWIYQNKLSLELITKLINKSTVHQKDYRVYLRPVIASLYMSLLAKHMANDDVNSITTPSTDDINFLPFAFPSVGDENTMSVMNLSLYNVLPIPAEGTSLINIIKFKERRKDELLQFRQRIYEHQDKLKQLENLLEVRDLNSRFAEQIQGEVSNLGKALKGDDIHFLFGSLKNILAIETPAMLVAYGMQFPDPIKIQIAVAGAVISGAISLGEYFLASQNKENERLAKNSYTYLLHAREEGII